MKKPADQLWYISGPVTNDPDYKKHFNDAEKFLKSRGFNVINPIKGEKEGKSWEYYLKRDIKKLLKCTGIIALPGYEESEGAKLELYIAGRLGYDFEWYPIIYDQEVRR